MSLNLGSNHELIRRLATDQLGRETWNTLFGDRVVSQRAAQIATSFEYNVSPRAAETSTTNSGSVTHDTTASQAIAATGTDSTASAYLSTIDTLRYRASHELYSYFTVVFTEPEVDSDQQVGFFCGGDGYFFGFRDTTFGCTRRKNNEDEFQTPNLDDLSGTNGSEINIDFTKNNLYRITYGWLGIAPAVYEVFAGAETGWVPFHVFSKANQITESEISVPNLPLRARVAKESSDSSTDISLRIGCMGGGLNAVPETDPASRSFSLTNSITIDADTRTNILTLKSKTNFQSKTNRIRAVLRMITVSSEGNKPVQLDIVKNGSLATSSFTDVDSDSSVMQSDTTKTEVTGGTSVHPLQLQKSDSTFVHLPGALDAAGIRWDPGDQISLTARSTQSSDIIGALRWLEQF